MGHERRGEALKRAVEMVITPLRNDVETMVEIENVSSATGSAGARPSAQVQAGDPVQVLEPYGFASTPPGTSQALVVAPGTDDENRVTTGLSAPAGRPSTDAGDAATWTSAGHSFILDNDGGITLTAKDGSSIDLPASGAINITAGTGASVTINVDGGQSANVGDGSAVALAKAQALETFLAAKFAAVTSPDPNIVAAFAALALSITGTPPPSLTTAVATSKAKGT